MGKRAQRAVHRPGPRTGRPRFPPPDPPWPFWSAGTARAAFPGAHSYSLGSNSPFWAVKPRADAAPAPPRPPQAQGGPVGPSRVAPSPPAPPSALVGTLRDAIDRSGTFHHPKPPQNPPGPPFLGPGSCITCSVSIRVHLLFPNATRAIICVLRATIRL